MRLKIVCMFFLFSQILISNDEFGFEHELNNLIYDCDLLCIGHVSKADISRGRTGGHTEYEISIDEIIYYDEKIWQFLNIEPLYKIKVQTFHNSIGYLSINKLFSSYIFLLHLDTVNKIYTNLIAFDEIWFDNNMIGISKKEYEKLNCRNCFYRACGFIDVYTDSEVYRKLIPKEIKKYKVKFLDPLGRKQLFVSLNNFLEYFNKIKSKKKD